MHLNYAFNRMNLKVKVNVKKFCPARGFAPERRWVPAPKLREDFRTSLAPWRRAV